MGSSRTRKSSSQPQTLGLPGDAHVPIWEPGEAGQRNRPDSIVISLIRIRLDSLRLSRVGDMVTLSDDLSGLLVLAPHGTLGQVPPHFEDALQQGGFSVGVLVTLELDPPRAKIKVS